MRGHELGVGARSAFTSWIFPLVAVLQLWVKMQVINLIKLPIGKCFT